MKLWIMIAQSDLMYLTMAENKKQAKRQFELAGKPPKPVYEVSPTPGTDVFCVYSESTVTKTKLIIGY